MKARPKPTKNLKAPQAPAAPTSALPDLLIEVNLPDALPEITEREIVAVLTAFQVLGIARADFEQKRAALALKLFALGKCEKGQYQVNLDEQDRLVFEEYSSEDPLTGRPIIERTVIPSVG